MPVRTAVLTYAGVLIGFKLWSVVLIYWFSGEAGTTNFLLGTHVLWIAIPVVLIWAPAMFRFRLVRMRRKRRSLQAAEWNVDQRPPSRR